MKLSQRDKLKKRTLRLAPERSELITNSADQLIEKLRGHNLLLVEKAGNGMVLASNELRFEKDQTGEKYCFVLLTFADDGELSFGVDFGIREYTPPHDWHLSANLARRKIGIRKTCDLGARWYMLSKERVFQKDWRFLLSNIDDIVRFLETGKTNRYMVDVMIFPQFEPYHK